MSRCFGDYSLEEQVNVLAFTNQNKKEQIEDLKDRVWMLEAEIHFLKEGINKLPKTERNITFKRVNRMRKAFLKEINERNGQYE